MERMSKTWPYIEVKVLQKEAKVITIGRLDTARKITKHKNIEESEEDFNMQYEPNTNIFIEK